MERRRFLLTSLAGALAAPVAGGAQPPARMWRIGYLDQGSEANNRLYVDGLTQGLADLGWVEGRTALIESRFAEGKTDQLPRLAAELVRSKPDVIVTSTTPAALAAKHATTTIPIVIGFVADSVGSGIVASLAHPVHQPSLMNIEEAARQLKVELHLAGAREPKELEGAVSGLMEKHIQALVVFPDGMFQSQTSQIVALAARHRLPAVYGLREFAEAGGLMAYGTNLATMHRELSASLVDKILKGARPATLPVAQPTKFDLLINLKTAKALGLTIPPSLLARADQVIQ